LVRDLDRPQDLPADSLDVRLSERCFQLVERSKKGGRLALDSFTSGDRDGELDEEAEKSSPESPLKELWDPEGLRENILLRREGIPQFVVMPL
jgi:hypothetical protein